ncbi:MAG: MOSC domain-containing protein [Synechococcaceae cyanobacterium]
MFDACPVHAISTATLAELQRLAPGLDFAEERFRPNLLIEPSGDSDFVKERWAGGALAIGERLRLRLRVDSGCPRCVITTLAQGELADTLEILRATARHNQVTAGIRLSVLTGGPLAVGDPVHWLEEI